MRVPTHIKTTSWSNDFFSQFFYNTIRYIKPEICVELGTYAGYSAYCIANALLDNMKGVLDCYDLWEFYPFHHVSKQEAQLNLLGLPVKLIQENALEAYKNYKDNSVDFLMVDISNDGDIYLKILNDWLPKLTKNASVILEGGSPERDKVDWMIKYNKKPIQEIIRNFEICDNYIVANIELFPSITICRKK